MRDEAKAYLARAKWLELDKAPGLDSAKEKMTDFQMETKLEKMMPSMPRADS